MFVNATTSPIVWLSTDLDSGETGAKAALLSRLRRAGLPVPDGFVVPVSAYNKATTASSLADRLATLREHVVRGASDGEIRVETAALRAEMGRVELPEDLRYALQIGFSRLMSEATAVAVRSSASTEDGAAASAAGQFETILGVDSAAALLDAVRQCWASIWTLAAVRYHQARSGSFLAPSMAVLIQRQVTGLAAGVAFTVDPVGGSHAIVVEAVRGFGDALARGQAQPERYRLDRHTLGEVEITPGTDGRGRVVPKPIVRALGKLALEVEQLVGAPQDLEWSWDSRQLWLLQARPVTAQAVHTSDEAFFSRFDWTSGFVDERLSEPVSPLGWSVVQHALEELAFREPLRWLGLAEPAFPLTRLWNGHPYLNVEIFKALYKLFPDWLLPEDTQRYFAGGDRTTRRSAPLPRSWLDPAIWLGLGCAVARDPSVLSPVHHARHWQAFAVIYEKRLTILTEQVAALEGTGDLPLDQALTLIDQVEAENRRLLCIHRWSLTHADVLYSALRRLSRRWLGLSAGNAFATGVGANLGDRSFELNTRLEDLAALARSSPPIREAIEHVGDHAPSLLELTTRLSAHEIGQKFVELLKTFLQTYGHRSHSLDLIRPTFADDPSQVVQLIRMLVNQGGRQVESVSITDKLDQVEAGEGWRTTPPPPSPWTGREPAGFGPFTGREPANFSLQSGRVLAGFPPFTGGLTGAGSPPGIQGAILRWLAGLTRDSLRLREDQRFAWQRGLWLLRRLYRVIGRFLVSEQILGSPDDVFFLTAAEIRNSPVLGRRDEVQRLIEERRGAYHDQLRTYATAPLASYPPFLRGNRPWQDGDSNPSARLAGQPVSWGSAEGPVRLVMDPSDLERVHPGDVLVTRAADPAWTPVFGRLAALVMESGGQLSHGAIVAREYGLPAVVAVHHASEQLHDGDWVRVDGAAGTVERCVRAGQT